MHHRLDIVVCLAFVWVVWGTCFHAITVAVQEIPPLLLAGGRNLLGGLLLLAGLAARRDALRPTLSLRRCAVLGLLFVGGGTAGTAMAAREAPAGSVALVVACIPLWVVGLSFLRGHAPTRRELTGVGTGVAGIALLSAGGGLGGSGTALAALLAATWCWALGSTLGRGWEGTDAPSSVASQMLAGGVLVVAAGLLLEGVPALPSTRALLAFAYLTGPGTAMAYLAYVTLTRKVTPGLAESFAFVNPVVALGIDALVLGVRPSSLATAAALLVLTAAGLLVTAPAPVQAEVEVRL